MFGIFCSIFPDEAPTEEAKRELEPVLMHYVNISQELSRIVHQNQNNAQQ